MSENIPTSYKDPYWSNLAESAASNNGVPSGWLSSIVVNGERSDNGATNQNGTRWPFQITASARKAALEKYGIDAFASPENGADVAAKLFKEGLDRNNGDPVQATGEYVGGLNRANWGNQTKAYIARVKNGISNSDLSGSTSTFDQEYSKMFGQQQNSIANIYSAYKNGQMTQQEKQDFENDVNSGKVMLPEGASLSAKDDGQRQSTNVIPQVILDAYHTGKMDQQARQELENDVSSGNVSLPTGQSLNMSEQIPGAKPRIVSPQENIAGGAVGAGEAGLSTLTGLTSGAIGQGVGSLVGIGQSIANGTFGTEKGVQQAQNTASKYGNALTYEPKTFSGQEQTEKVNELLSNLVPLTGIHESFGPIVDNTKALIEKNKDLPLATKAAIVNGAQKIAEKFKRDKETSAEGSTVGAQRTPQELVRQSLADNFFGPDEALTKGQATNDFEAQRFEKEAEKNPQIGAPLRQRFDRQNAALTQQLDQWIDDTGGTTDLRNTGMSVSNALQAQADARKAQYQQAFQQADTSPEAQQFIDYSPVAQYLASSRSAEGSAPILRSTRNELARLDALTPSPSGNPEITMAQAFDLRRFINANVNQLNNADLYHATQLKNVIDATTQSQAGPLYERAIRLRSQYGQLFEQPKLINSIMSTKPGSNDRQVAYEDVYQKAIKNGSYADIANLRSTLNRSEEGRQAWRNLQAQTLHDIREQALSTQAKNSLGDTIISAAKINNALKGLDQDGKLDLIFGKNNAQNLRDLSELSGMIRSAPPGAINTSNTGAILLQALDHSVGHVLTGLPIPIATIGKRVVQNIKNRELKTQVVRHLNYSKKGK